MQGEDPVDTYQQTLDRHAALVNTLALITGSDFVARVVARVRDGDNRSCVRWLLAALAIGVLFLLTEKRQLDAAQGARRGVSGKAQRGVIAGYYNELQRSQAPSGA